MQRGVIDMRCGYTDDLEECDYETSVVINKIESWRRLDSNSVGF